MSLGAEEHSVSPSTATRAASCLYYITAADPPALLDIQSMLELARVLSIQHVVACGIGSEWPQAHWEPTPSSKRRHEAENGAAVGAEGGVLHPVARKLLLCLALSELRSPGWHLRVLGGDTYDTGDTYDSIAADAEKSGCEEAVCVLSPLLTRPLTHAFEASSVIAHADAALDASSDVQLSVNVCVARFVIQYARSPFRHVRLYACEQSRARVRVMPVTRCGEIDDARSEKSVAEPFEKRDSDDIADRAWSVVVHASPRERVYESVTAALGGMKQTHVYAAVRRLLAGQVSNKKGMARAAECALYAMLPGSVASAMRRYRLPARSAKLAIPWLHAAFGGVPFPHDTPLYVPELFDSTPGMPAAAPKAATADALSGMPSHVYILGGSFSPVTSGHMHLALDVLRTIRQRELQHEQPHEKAQTPWLWLVPCGARPDKPTLPAPWLRHVLAISAVEEMARDDPGIAVVPLELHAPKAEASYELLSKLRFLHLSTNFSLIIGADLVPQLHTWRYAPKLLAECSLLVLPRVGSGDVDDAIRALSVPHKVKALNIDEDALTSMSISSSEVRARLKRRLEHESVLDVLTGIVPASVAALIAMLTMYDDK